MSLLRRSLALSSGPLTRPSHAQAVRQFRVGRVEQRAAGGSGGSGRLAAGLVGGAAGVVLAGSLVDWKSLHSKHGIWIPLVSPFMINMQDTSSSSPVHVDLTCRLQVNAEVKNQKLIEKENKIRQYSTPDKIFRYFATYRVTDEKGHTEVMMSPEDFLRSITPGLTQSETLGIDKFTSVTTRELGNLSTKLGLGEESIFYQLGANGLISFSDYVFLVTVLNTSRRHFEIAFKMFDLDGDGTVDAEEFEEVTTLMKNQSSIAARKSDDQTKVDYKGQGMDSGLSTYFFGQDHKGVLTVEAFLDFQTRLQKEILTLEFKRMSNGKRLLDEKDFAELLIVYGGFGEKKKNQMLKRVIKNMEQGEGITLKDYINFYQVLYSINDIDTALTFYHVGGAGIDGPTLQHVARTVTGVDLSEHLIDVVFTTFDDNGDGKLSNKEFVSVMKRRAMRSLEKPQEYGFGQIFSAVRKCASSSTSKTVEI